MFTKSEWPYSTKGITGELAKQGQDDHKSATNWLNLEQLSIKLNMKYDKKHHSPLHDNGDWRKDLKKKQVGTNPDGTKYKIKD